MARTFSTPITLPGDAVGALQAVPKQQLDASLVGKASTTHAASHARGGADTLAPSIATINYATTITPDAAAAQLHRCTATGDLILAAPTGAADGREISVEILASGAIRNLTIAAAILLTQGITTPVVIASGKRWFGALRHINGVGWFLLASTQQS